MANFKNPIPTEDRIVRATLPYWWPVAVLAACVFIYLIAI